MLAADAGHAASSPGCSSRPGRREPRSALRVLYALSRRRVVLRGAPVRPVRGAATAAALLAYPGYVLLFHELASDALFAAAFALVALLSCCVRVEHADRWRASVALGLGIVALVLARPVGQVLAAARARRRSSPRVARAPARGGRRRASPSRRSSSRSSRSPASQRGARRRLRGRARRVGVAPLPHVRRRPDRRAGQRRRVARSWRARSSRELLPHEPYRSRGIDLETFFSSGSSRMHDDLTVLSDRTWGWDDDYRAPRPRRRARRSARTPGPTRAASRRTSGACFSGRSTRRSRRRQRAGPAPGRSRPRRAARSHPRPRTSRSRPRARRRTSPRRTGGSARCGRRRPSTRFVFRDAADARARGGARPRGERASRTASRTASATPSLSSRARQRPLAPLPAAVHVAPRRARRRRSGAARAGSPFQLALAAAALAVMVSTSLAVYAVAEYSVPVVPAFVLLATAGALRSALGREARWRRRLRSPVGDAGPAPRPEDRARSSAARPTSTPTRGWRSSPTRAG